MDVETTKKVTYTATIELKDMNLFPIIEEFANNIASGNTEVYNEASVTLFRDCMDTATKIYN